MHHIFRTLLLCCLWSLQTFASAPSDATTFDEKSYVVKRGNDAIAFHGMMNDRYRPVLQHALAATAAFGVTPATGINVVDFGCGVGSTYTDIKNWMGPVGTYVGVDVHADDLKIAETRWPGSIFIHGDQNTPHVQEVLKKADLVFMSLVTMHQTNGTHLTFLQNLYDNMRPGAVLIDVGFAITTDHEKKLRHLYPQVSALLDLRARVTQKKNLNFNVFENYATLASQLTPPPVVRSVREENISHISVGLKELQGLVMVAKAKQNELDLTDTEIKAASDALASMPSGPDDFWYSGERIGYILRKPLGQTLQSAPSAK